MQVRRLLTAGDIVGESAVWSEARQELLWVDIVGRRIQSFSVATGEHRVWQMPELVTSLGLACDGGAIVGFRRHIALWNFEDHFETLALVEPDLPDNRLNEGCVGPDGAYWVGTMQDNIAADGQPKPITRASGAIYRVTGEGRVQRLTSPNFGICNTMAWVLPDRFLCADTLANQLYAYQWDSDGLHEGRVFASHDRGLPDGSALDEEGCLWNARVGGGCVVRFGPDGQVDATVDLPCSAPTSCAFGGEDRRTLFVTSARFGLPEHRANEPDEGALFAIDAGVGGAAPFLFG